MAARRSSGLAIGAVSTSVSQPKGPSQTMPDAPIRLLAIGGSTRATSRTLVAMRALLESAPDHGIEVEIASIHDLALPVYNDDIPLEGQPATLRRLVERVREADAYLIMSPTYHGSMTGAIKNALDSLHVTHGRPDAYFQDRPVGIAAYGGPSAINVVNSLQTVVRTMRGIVAPTVVAVSRDVLDPETGSITDAQTRRRADAMLREMATAVAMRRAHEAAVTVAV
jgi:FMN reductase